MVSSSHKCIKSFIAIAMFMFVVMLTLGAKPAAAASPSIDLNHWVNGSLVATPCSSQTSTAHCTWINGDLTKVHNHYAEGDTVPNRFVFSNLPSGDFQLT